MFGQVFFVSVFATRNVGDVVVRKGVEVGFNEGRLQDGYLGSFSVEGFVVAIAPVSVWASWY